MHVIKFADYINTIMAALERLVMPGDNVTDDTEDKTGVVLGPGLRREAGDQVRVTKPGVMRMRVVNDKKVFWVDVHCKRYVANRGENVIGVVTAKMGDTFRLVVKHNILTMMKFMFVSGLILELQSPPVYHISHLRELQKETDLM